MSMSNTRTDGDGLQGGRRDGQTDGTGRMTYPSPRAPVESEGPGTVTVPTLSSLIWMVLPSGLCRYLRSMWLSRSASRITAMSSGLSRWRWSVPRSDPLLLFPRPPSGGAAGVGILCS